MMSCIVIANAYVKQIEMQCGQQERYGRSTDGREVRMPQDNAVMLLVG